MSGQKKEANKQIERFWKDVNLRYVPAEEVPEVGEDHFVIQLDNRSLRTPGGNILRVPSERPLLACLTAQEWDEQEKVLRPTSLPITSLIARSIDGFVTERDRADVEQYLLKYLDTDATCFYEDEPPALAALQEKRWDPLIAWAKEHFQIDINVAINTLSNKQPDATRERVAQILASLEPLDLASMERAVMTSKSIIIGLALVYRRIDAEQAALAAEVETAAQASIWGAVEDSHDVDHADLRERLASVACAQVITEPELVGRFVDVLHRKYGN
ncbi:Atp12p [Malassezia vespertilionis]|uniref:Atp12p n=2 Tax=Malassezia vespertilionis TaxID=2020962 RepID=A0A2N1JG13_9BASI|nr:Atp12p [Malassezia vespertilionis]